jgi:4-amino-4-deoxy-L-arabinose transferase-like glycosyltransferase
MIGAGVAHWQTGRFEPYAVNPPLIRMIATLPLLLLDPLTDYSTIIPSVPNRPEVSLGAHFLRANADHIQLHFGIARFTCVALAAAGLVVAMDWSRKLYGSRGALIVGALLCFSPMWLSHGSLITPDAGASTFGLIAFFQLRRFLLNPSTAMAGCMGLSVGLALGTKFTWLLVIPPVFLVVWVANLIAGGASFQRLKKESRGVVLAVCVALLTINTLYCFDQSFLPIGEISCISDGLKSNDDDGNSSGSTPNRFTNTLVGRVPMPIPALYIQGIDFQKSCFEEEHFSRSYLMGEWKKGGWWYYYLIGLLIKSPICTLCLGLMAMLSGICSVCVRSQHSLRAFETTSLAPVIENLLLLLPCIFVMVVVSRETGFNRHLRYVLPAICRFLI